ncbi:MAG: hypothetical protein ACI8ZM_004667 [Crocinitomix sp.]|jgi:hypothetical protein
MHNTKEKTIHKKEAQNNSSQITTNGIKLADNRNNGLANSKADESALMLDKRPASLLQRKTIPINATKSLVQLQSDVVQRITVEGARKVFDKMKGDGSAITEEAYDLFITEKISALPYFDEKKVRHELEKRIGQSAKIKKRGAKQKKHEAAKSVTQDDPAIVQRGRLAIHEILRIMAYLGKEHTDGLIGKFNQSSRSSSPEICAQSLKGHLYELASLYMERKNGGTLMDATGQADTKYHMPGQGVIATQNKWAMPSTLRKNIYAALRQLSGRKAEKPHHTEPDNVAHEIPHGADKLVADVVVEGKHLSTQKEVVEIVIEAQRTLAVAVNKLPELRGRSIGIRIVYADHPAGLTQHLTLYAPNGDPSNLKLTTKPEIFPAATPGSRAAPPKVNMVLRVIDYANAISQLGIGQRLQFFDKK